MTSDMIWNLTGAICLIFIVSGGMFSAVWATVQYWKGQNE